MVSLVLFSYLFPELWSLNCQKLCPFRNFLMMSAKNLRQFIALYVYAPTSSRLTLSENGVGHNDIT